MQTSSNYILIKKIWLDAIAGLPDSDQLAFVRAICAYQSDGVEPSLSGALQVAFLMAKPDIDGNKKHYDEVCEKRRAATAQREINKYQMISNDSNEHQMISNDIKRHQTALDNDYDYDNDNIDIKENTTYVVKEKSNPVVADKSATATLQKTSKIQKREKTGILQRPTIEEIKAEIAAKGYTFDAEGFYDFYESNGWKVGRNPMKSWKAACGTWQKREGLRRPKPTTKEPPRFYNNSVTQYTNKL